MSSRDFIINTIQKHLPQAVPLPPHAGPWIRYDDPVQRFQEVLESVGGTLHHVNSINDIPDALGDLADESKTVVSCVAGLLEDRFDLDAIGDPHDLQHVDLAILPGELCVAENAAVWVTDDAVPMRVLFFLSQHLALVVEKSAIVHNMHEAYELIDAAAGRFGCFISGPSKTADIEQSLVKGAHGARTMSVFLVEDLGK